MDCTKAAYCWHYSCLLLPMAPSSAQINSLLWYFLTKVMLESFYQISLWKRPPWCLNSNFGRNYTAFNPFQSSSKQLPRNDDSWDKISRYPHCLCALFIRFVHHTLLMFQPFDRNFRSKWELDVSPILCSLQSMTPNLFLLAKRQLSLWSGSNQKVCLTTFENF